MPKYNDLNQYILTFNDEAKKYYFKIKDLINEIDLDIKEKLFAGQVAFYVEETLKRTFHESPVIVMAFFKDHVNVFASGNIIFKDKLPYKFTNKGTMQIYYDKDLDHEILKELFMESLKG